MFRLFELRRLVQSFFAGQQDFPVGISGVDCGHGTLERGSWKVCEAPLTHYFHSQWFHLISRMSVSNANVFTQTWVKPARPDLCG